MSNLNKAIQLKKSIDKLRPFSSDIEAKIWQKFKLEWNYHSNKIEGNSLSYGETKALILHNITASGKPLKDHFEITGHNEAINWILGIIKKERPISENFIRELHTLILKEPYEIDTESPSGLKTKKIIKVGSYKETNNHVKTISGEIFYFSNWEDVPYKMNELIEWYKKESKNNDAHPIELAAQFHYRFIRIHPFDDGNGRLARILMNFILLQHDFPPAIIKTSEKKEYFRVLQIADSGDIGPFIEFIADNVNWSQELMISAANGENIEDVDDIDKEIKLLEIKLKESGKLIELTKNAENVEKVITQSVIPIFNKFFIKSKLFDGFYERVLPQIIVDQKTIQYDIATMNYILKSEGHNSTSICFNYYFYNLKTGEKSNFKYNSEIKITFNNSNYIITDQSNNWLFEAKYGVFISENEINEIITKEIKKHQEAIEHEIN